MAKIRSFTETGVSKEKTQEQMEVILAKHNIRASQWRHIREDEVAGLPGRLMLEFPWQNGEGIVLDFRVEVEYKAERGPKGGQIGTTVNQAARAIYWFVDMLFKAVEWGIVEDIGEAFFSKIVTDDGHTLYQRTMPMMTSVAHDTSRVFPALGWRGQHR